MAIKSLARRFWAIKLGVLHDELVWQDDIVMLRVHALPISLNTDATKP